MTNTVSSTSNNMRVFKYAFSAFVIGMLLIVVFFSSSLLRRVPEHQKTIERICFSSQINRDILRSLVNRSTNVQVPAGITNPDLILAYKAAKENAIEYKNFAIAQLDRGDQELKKVGCAVRHATSTTTTINSPPPT